MTRLKSALSHLEIGVGLIALLISLYSFLSQLDCPDRAVDCHGWALLIAQFALNVGASALVSGLLLRDRGVISWLGHLLILYTASFYYFIS
jgi:hypothetical protein